MAPKLILTGFMAAGKSAVGRAVAARLGLRLRDSDAELVARAGRPIEEIFARDGEAHFRALEREVIAELAADAERCPRCGAARAAVISTGGGALVDERNHAALKRAGVIVCLTARPEVVAARVRRSRETRPKLLEGGKPLEQRIAELMEERRTAYARADFTVDTSDLTVAEAAERVIEIFTAHGGAAAGAHQCAASV
ncbi:MAG TPA: shikimate kinase [Candidatus Binataceae bacterium]|jgi:shikimate kinase|nr:shikimate kinase [Candidatus Binataceae bacterium]